MIWRERTKKDQNYSKENYGDGSPPERLTVIISDTSGNGVISGKAYRVVSHRAWVYEIIAEKGVGRIFSMYSDSHGHGRLSELIPAMCRVFEQVEDDGEECESCSKERKPIRQVGYSYCPMCKTAVLELDPYAAS